MPNLVLSESIADRSARIFHIHAQRIAWFLPDAEIYHIGATSIPGLWTKGDVDLLIRVDPPRFAEADSMLATSYVRNTGSIRNSVFASFHGAGDLGIQLVSKGSDMDFFLCFRDALRQSAELRDAYNELKRRHAEASDEDYRAAKDRFIADVLAASKRK